MKQWAWDASQVSCRVVRPITRGSTFVCHPVNTDPAAWALGTRSDAGKCGIPLMNRGFRRNAGTPLEHCFLRQGHNPVLLPRTLQPGIDAGEPDGPSDVTYTIAISKTGSPPAGQSPSSDCLIRPPMGRATAAAIASVATITCSSDARGRHDHHQDDLEIGRLAGAVEDHHHQGLERSVALIESGNGDVELVAADLGAGGPRQVRTR